MIALALLFTCLVGHVCLPASIPAVLRFCMGFTLGAGILSLQLLLYNLAHVPWSRLTVLAPWILVLGFLLERRRPWLARPAWTRPRGLEWFALAFAVLVLAAWVPYERLMPLNEWDAVMLWMFKGKAFYLDGGIQPYLARAHEFLGNPAYPLLIPLYSTFLYLWTGEVADHAAKVFSPCFFVSLVAGFYYFARRLGPRVVAAVFTAMLMGLYILGFVAFHYAGYADTAVAAAVLLGAGFLYAWHRDGEHADLALAMLFTSIAAWTKNEGQFFLAGAGAAAVARLLWKRLWNWRLWAALAGFPALAILPWALARSLTGVKRPGQLSSEFVQTNVAAYWPTLKALVEHAFAPSIMNLAFFLWLAAFLLYRRAGLDHRFLLLPGLVLWQLAGVCLVYVTGPVSLQWMIGSSLDRVLSQVAPLALLCAAVPFASYYERAEAARPKTPAARIKSRKVR